MKRPSLGSQAVQIYPPPCTPPPSPLGINSTENLPESLSTQVPCTGPLASAQQLFRKRGPSAEFSPPPLSGFLPSHALPSFPLLFPLPPAPRPPQARVLPELGSAPSSGGLPTKSSSSLACPHCASVPLSLPHTIHKAKPRGFKSIIYCPQLISIT